MAAVASTIHDYARFLQMMLNGGELDGVRILSPKTVELMTTDHIGDVPVGSVVQPGSAGLGLGFAVRGRPGREGELGSEGPTTEAASSARASGSIRRRSSSGS